jgi:hypothetical protein
LWQPVRCNGRVATVANLNRSAGFSPDSRGIWGAAGGKPGGKPGRSSPALAEGADHGADSGADPVGPNGFLVLRSGWVGFAGTGSGRSRGGIEEAEDPRLERKPSIPDRLARAPRFCQTIPLLAKPRVVNQRLASSRPTLIVSRGIFTSEPYLPGAGWFTVFVVFVVEFARLSGFSSVLPRATARPITVTPG